MTQVINKDAFDEQPVARKCVWLLLALLMFVIFFYSGTVAMSILYPLNEAILGF
ncbi:MAG TPA: hypothetical protein VHM64_06975 [Candidatus Binatia bacterium]|nr:hypothetical protein [Candidatus Binatia bacterium]